MNKKREEMFGHDGKVNCACEHCKSVRSDSDCNCDFCARTRGERFRATFKARKAAKEFGADPLPRCVHDACLIDGAGERLEPPCGCRA